MPSNVEDHYSRFFLQPILHNQHWINAGFLTMSEDSCWFPRRATLFQQNPTKANLFQQKADLFQHKATFFQQKANFFQQKANFFQLLGKGSSQVFNTHTFKHHLNRMLPKFLECKIFIIMKTAPSLLVHWGLSGFLYCSLGFMWQMWSL